MSYFQDNFVPSANVITAISNTSPAVIVTLTSHGYDDGLYIRVIVPKNCGMQQINGQVGVITVITPISFSISINALNFDSFAYTSIDQIAQVIPVGEESDSLAQAERNAKNITPEY
jgi:hypothetical protein